MPERKSQSSGQAKPRKGESKAKRSRLLGLVIAMGTAFAFLAAFSKDLVSVWENFRKLFLPEPLKVTVHNRCVEGIEVRMDNGGCCLHPNCPPTKFGN